jgi:hypothetical protein
MNKFTYLMPPPDSIISGTIQELTPERAAEWLRKRGWSIGEVHWLFNGWEPVSKLVGNYIPPANAGEDTDRLRRAIATGGLVSIGNDEGEALYSPADVIRVCEEEDFGCWQTWKNMVEQTPPASPDVEGTAITRLINRNEVMAAFPVKADADANYKFWNGRLGRPCGQLINARKDSGKPGTSALWAPLGIAHYLLGGGRIKRHMRLKQLDEVMNKRFPKLAALWEAQTADLR